MKVSKCSEKSEVKTPILSYDQIARTVGVYQLADSRYYDAKWIVIDTSTVLIFEKGNLFTSSKTAWQGHEFIPTNETVCFELKPA